ncbi:MAG: trypsin-like peptidase domain-containing protein [Lentisphaeria bacterium]|nr:trypsin-like peptidase domain-containing protein [Lentisphaeria bacterium]
MDTTLTGKRFVRAMVAALFMTGASYAADSPDKGMELALKLEDVFTGVAARAFQAVVVITNKQTQVPMQGMQGMQGGQGMTPELFRRFFGQPRMDPRNHREGRQHGHQDRKSKPRPAGKGSGVVIRADGYIVTNLHVIDGASALEVKLEDGRVFDNAKDADAVRIVGIDKSTDLAVLQIGGGKLADLPVIQFADSEKVRIGQWAIAVGAPFDLDYSVTFGHVSQKGRHDTGMTTFENYIQTDASINPGNSGGPLLDIRGDMIGVNEFILTGGGMSRGSVGIGFAIASNLAKQVTDDLIEHGEVIRPFLGISMEPLDDVKKRAFGVEYGVLVKEVVKGDPADKAGVRHGDIIQKVGDKQVRTPHDLLFAILDYKVGDKIKLTIDRRGEMISKKITAKKRGTPAGTGIEIKGQQDLLDALGLVLEEVDGGVYISAVVDASPAADAQLRRGDHLLEVNRIEVRTTRDVVKALERVKNNAAIFYVDRRGEKFFVGIPLGEGK